MIFSRKWLFGLLLVVPLIGFGVAEAIQAHFDVQLRSFLRQEYPEATERQIAEVTVQLLCEDDPSELRDLCSTHANLQLMSRAAVAAGVVGLILLLLIRLAGGLARNSRHLLVVFFRPGLYLTVLVLIGLVLVHAAIAMAAIYYGGSVFIGWIHGGIIGAIGLGAIAGAYAMIRSSFSMIRKAQAFVVGKGLSREQAPQLWNQVDQLASKLGALPPDNLVVGLEPNFFVTEADVICLDRVLGGRTLYCSLPLCRILTMDELNAIIGHELGHFRGEDTKFSKRFYPIYRGTSSSLEALQAAGGGGAGALALLPAVAVLSYFLECFSVAESSLSRERELVADRAASIVTTPRSIAVALVKLHAFTGMWLELQEAAISALREGKMFVNASTLYAGAVQQNAVPEVLEGLDDTHLTHPTDTHPPLMLRLESLQLAVSDVATDALDVSSTDSAIALIPVAEQLEEELSGAYQDLLARQLGLVFEAAEEVPHGGA